MDVIAEEQADFPFVVGRRKLVCILDAEKPQKGTVLRRFHVQILRAKHEYAFRYSIDYPLSGASCPAYDSFPSPRAAANRAYLAMHRWVRQSAPDQYKAIKELRLWFHKHVLSKL